MMYDPSGQQNSMMAGLYRAPVQQAPMPAPPPISSYALQAGGAQAPQQPQMGQQQAPIMNPNANYMMAALSGQSPNQPSVGTPNANSPSINMQDTPFLNQLRLQ